MKRMIVASNNDMSPQDSMRKIDEQNRSKWIAAILKGDKDNLHTREDLERLPMKALEDLYMNS